MEIRVLGHGMYMIIRMSLWIETLQEAVSVTLGSMAITRFEKLKFASF